MDNALSACAPGKVVWLGEYAVLDGAPAVVAAIDRYVVARANPAAHWSLKAINLPGEPRAWPDIKGHAGDDPLALPAALLDRLAASGLLQSSAQCIEIDSSALYLDGQKIGVGSSAAVLVALFRLLVKESLAPDKVFALIDAAHRQCQMGLGSGIDIAAAVHGGVLQFERDPRWAVARSTPLTPPDTLFVGVIFTGASTSTSDFVARVVRWRAQAQREYSAYFDALAALAVAGCAALREQDAAEFCALAARYGEVLDAFGKAAGIDIVSAVHRRLQQLGRDYGVAYKTSGAGGRDLGIAFATDASALAQFLAAADSLSDCRSLDLAVAPVTALASAAK